MQCNKFLQTSINRLKHPDIREKTAAVISNSQCVSTTLLLLALLLLLAILYRQETQ